MALYAIISPGGAVINMINWDGVSTYNVAPNTAVLATGQANAQVGGTYANGTFTAPAAPAPAQGIILLSSPASGAVLALPNPPQPQAVLYVILEPAAALAALTLNLPPSPNDGDELYLLSIKAITAVTPVAGAGQNLINIPSPFALAAGVSQRITWSAQYSSWFRL